MFRLRGDYPFMTLTFSGKEKALTEREMNGGKELEVYCPKEVEDSNVPTAIIKKHGVNVLFVP